MANFTNDQYLVIQNDINNNPTLLGYWNAGAPGLIAAFYNGQAVPDWTVWRTSVDVNEIMNNGFDWTVVDNLATGRARIWEWMTQMEVINPSKQNIRQGMNQAFQGFQTMIDGIIPHMKRLSNELEKLFSQGVGSDADPATMTVEGGITHIQVIEAMNAT